MRWRPRSPGRETGLSSLSDRPLNWRGRRKLYKCAWSSWIATLGISGQRNTGRSSALMSYLGRDKLIEAILKAVPGWDNVGRLMSNISSVSSWLRLLRLRWFKSLQWWRRKHFLFAGREQILIRKCWIIFLKYQIFSQCFFWTTSHSTASNKESRIFIIIQQNQ